MLICNLVIEPIQIYTLFFNLQNYNLFFMPYIQYIIKFSKKLKHRYYRL